jgi:polysaccharide pyruvyl transferase WcaK-like protein
VLGKLSGTPTTKRVLVHGWYHNQNLGDDLFVDAFSNLFPHYQLTFVNFITASDLQNVDAVFIGGGSFLDQELAIESNIVLDELKKLPIFYIGVGVEAEIHKTHFALLQLAKLVAIRSSHNLALIKALNSNTIIIPDLVYSLPANLSLEKDDNSILIVPNFLVIPSWDEAHWKHAAWEYFKNEFAQTLDYFCSLNYKISFLPFSTNGTFDDRAASYEIINRMTNRQRQFVLDLPASGIATINHISRYNVVVTQRYHGIILSEMAGVPYVSIYHHDKLKNCSGSKLSYYGTNKSQMIEEINKAFEMKTLDILPIDRDIFRDLVEKVEYALCGHQK